jgi:hypothetical protein
VVHRALSQGNDDAKAFTTRRIRKNGNGSGMGGGLGTGSTGR